MDSTPVPRAKFQQRMGAVYGSKRGAPARRANSERLLDETDLLQCDGWFGILELRERHLFVSIH